STYTGAVFCSLFATTNVLARDEGHDIFIFNQLIPSYAIASEKDFEPDTEGCCVDCGIHRRAPGRDRPGNPTTFSAASHHTGSHRLPGSDHRNESQSGKDSDRISE